MTFYMPGSGEHLGPTERLLTYGTERRRKRKKRGFWGSLFRETLVWLLIGAVIVLAVEAVPYLMKLEPCDIMNYSDSTIFEKVYALRDGFQGKQGLSKMTFSHDGKTVTLSDDNGTLTEASDNGYDDESDFQRDVDEARRILAEWGLDK